MIVYSPLVSIFFICRTERDMSRLLRNEQDAEYKKSLETDKKKMEERKQKEDAEKEVERLKKEKEDEGQRKIEVANRSYIKLKFNFVGGRFR